MRLTLLDSIKKEAVRSCRQPIMHFFFLVYCFTCLWVQIDLQHHAQRLLLFLVFDVCWLQLHRCLEGQGHCPRWALEEKKRELKLGKNLL